MKSAKIGRSSAKVGGLAALHNTRNSNNQFIIAEMINKLTLAGPHYTEKEITLTCFVTGHRCHFHLVSKESCLLD